MLLLTLLMSSFGFYAAQISDVDGLPHYANRLNSNGLSFIIKADGTAEISAGVSYLYTSPSLIEYWEHYPAGSCGPIPMYLSGCLVTSIGRYAFYTSGGSSVTIPSSVTKIGGLAFWGVIS